MRKKHGHPLIDWLMKFWPMIVFVLGGLSGMVILPYRVAAIERAQQEYEEDQQVLMQQTQQIGQWIKAQEERNKYLRNPPPGYRWDDQTQDWVPEQPRRSR